jgi:hypothetical protein
MALSKNDTDILEKIVELDGNCIDSKRCKVCPFRAMCLPEFVYPNPPSQEQRRKMAMDVLTHHALMDEDTQVTEFKWDKRS